MQRPASLFRLHAGRGARRFNIGSIAMRKLLLTAGALMLGVALMGTAVAAQDDPAKLPAKEDAKSAEAAKAAVYKATIAGMK